MSISSDQVVIASSAANAAAVSDVRSAHAEIAGALGARLVPFITATESAGGGLAAATAARSAFADTAIEQALQRVRLEISAFGEHVTEATEIRPLLEVLYLQESELQLLLQEVLESPSPVRAAAAARAFVAAITTLNGQISEVLVPLLARNGDVDLAATLTSVTQELAARAGTEGGCGCGAGGCGGGGGGKARASVPAETEPSAPAPASGGCGCGGHGHGHDEVSEPELDSRAVPHAIRHATIFGALAALKVSESMILIASHDPLPLLRQLEERHQDQFTHVYVENGPEVWRLRFTRQQ